MKKKEEQLQNSLDRVKLQKHVYELCRVQKLTINEVRKKQALEWVLFTVIFIPLRKKTQNW